MVSLTSSTIEEQIQLDLNFFNLVTITGCTVLFQKHSCPAIPPLAGDDIAVWMPNLVESSDSQVFNLRISAPKSYAGHNLRMGLDLRLVQGRLRQDDLPTFYISSKKQPQQDAIPKIFD